MNAISLHINYLLRHHDCVIVPGFGAFIKSRNGAYVDEQGTLHAPSSSICFNPSIVNNDGILVNSLARKNSCSFEEATLLMATYVAMWRKALKKENMLSVRGIGRFEKGEEDRLVFTPAYNDAGHNAMVGKQDISAGKTPQVKEVVESAEHVTRDRDKKYYVIRINKAKARVAAAIMALIVVAVGAFHFVDRNELALPTEQKASVVPLPTLPVKEKQQEEIQTAPESEETAAETTYRYHIVVGAFRTQTEADNYLESHATDDLRSVPSTKLIHIIAASSDDREVLREKINSKEFQESYPQAWILEKDF